MPEKEQEPLAHIVGSLLSVDHQKETALLLLESGITLYVHGQGVAELIDKVTVGQRLSLAGVLEQNPDYQTCWSLNLAATNPLQEKDKYTENLIPFGGAGFDGIAPDFQDDFKAAIALVPLKAQEVPDLPPDFQETYFQSHILYDATSVIWPVGFNQPDGIIDETHMKTHDRALRQKMVDQFYVSGDLRQQSLSKTTYKDNRPDYLQNGTFVSLNYQGANSVQAAFETLPWLETGPQAWFMVTGQSDRREIWPKSFAPSLISEFLQKTRHFKGALAEDLPLSSHGRQLAAEMLAVGVIAQETDAEMLDDLISVVKLRALTSKPALWTGDILASFCTYLQNDRTSHWAEKALEIAEEQQLSEERLNALEEEIETFRQVQAEEKSETASYREMRTGMVDIAMPLSYGVPEKRAELMQGFYSKFEATWVSNHVDLAMEAYQKIAVTKSDYKDRLLMNGMLTSYRSALEEAVDLYADRYDLSQMIIAQERNALWASKIDHKDQISSLQKIQKVFREVRQATVSQEQSEKFNFDQNMQQTQGMFGKTFRRFIRTTGDVAGLSGSFMSVENAVFQSYLKKPKQTLFDGVLSDLAAEKACLEACLNKGAEDIPATEMKKLYRLRTDASLKLAALCHQSGGIGFLQQQTRISDKQIMGLVTDPVWYVPQAREDAPLQPMRERYQELMSIETKGARPVTKRQMRLKI